MKPEIVLEGGNATIAPDTLVELPDALRLLSTNWKPNERLLETTGDTSAAAALASRMAVTLLGRLDKNQPEVWPETVRALIVHSARWTPRMRSVLTGLSLRQGKDLLLSRYGWGVPDLERSAASSTNALTLVAQRTIQPFVNDADPGKAPDVKTKDWHLYELPWPKSALAALGATEVQLRVTLSYFVEPNPARRGWNSKRRYQSAGLRFGVKNATESIDMFRARMSKNEQDEEAGLPGQAEPGWFLGTARDRGSVHSDVWAGSAADLAERGHIAVYPVNGWWRHRVAEQRYNEEMRYTLVVSIEVPDVDVDIYTPVAVEVGVVIET